MPGLKNHTNLVQSNWKSQFGHIIGIYMQNIIMLTGKISFKSESYHSLQSFHVDSLSKEIHIFSWPTLSMLREGPEF